MDWLGAYLLALGAVTIFLLGFIVGWRSGFEAVRDAVKGD